MAAATVYGIIEQVLTNLGSRAVDEVALAWGFKDNLDKLKHTITTIKNVLLDAEDRQADSHAIRDWLERLATTVYDADDLFDEVATLASRKQLMGGNTVAKKVKTFFSSSNQITLPFRISRRIKTIRQNLDNIVKDIAEFNFVSRPCWEGSVINNVRGRDQTISHVDSSEIIGRDGDKQAILDLLVAAGETENEALHVIPIVGMGGQGKTALAQVVFNDPQVEKHFELRLWVCVSVVFDIKEITEKVLKSATNTEAPKLELEQLQHLLRNKIGDKRYLLILDDVWTENRDEWLKLMAVLKIGREGSKILVTTRSWEVANIMGTVPDPYELKGLLEDKSWELFQRMAFKPGQHQENPHRMMEVGKEIVKKCANSPLAIRAMGSLLYGKDEGMWESLLKNRSLVNISDGKNHTLEILKLSYHHLPPPLKDCFAYCSLFPKDYGFDKESLIDLWMAEGFISPKNNEGHNMEELAEAYFQFLLQRCFFQDITRTEWGNIVSCKMHDLMHDLAIHVAGVRCKLVAESNGSNADKGTLHLSFAYPLTSSWKIPPWMLNLKPLRTFLTPLLIGSCLSKSICEELISSFRCLRVLDLESVGAECSLPSSVGNLIHLRYLDLSCAHIRKLPDSITKLQNLQTLNLFLCEELRALPINMRKLYNLRSLDVRECWKVEHMPPGLGELTSLIKLPEFKVNGKGYAKLGDLKTINNLKGNLALKIGEKIHSALFEATEANLKDKHRLTGLRIIMINSDEDDSRISHDEDLLEGLKPHRNLKQLDIHRYKGRKLPSWALRNNLCTTLPKLVQVSLKDCNNCQQVPSFGQLPFLKLLEVTGLRSVKYMETESSADDLSLLSDSSSTFFPFLEELTLHVMDHLEGWWEGGANVNDSAKSFPKLSKLEIRGCPMLKVLPLCPNVEELTLVDVNRAISVSNMATSTSGSDSKLKKLEISCAEDLKSLPRECLSQLLEVEVKYDEDMVSTDEVFTSLFSSLRTLEFDHCKSLTFLGQELVHLTALEKLALCDCEQLQLSSNEQLPWRNLKSLRRLEIYKIPKLLSLPSGLQHLANLHTLMMSGNANMEELPEWISCFCSLKTLELWDSIKLAYLPDSFRKLTSLIVLRIIGCPKLTERCRAPHGADWPKIQHIPNVFVRD